MRYHFSKENFLKALRKIGIKKGDLLWVFTDLGNLGLPEGIKSKDDLCRFYYLGLREIIGSKGTLIVPLYSYTFGKNFASEPVSFKDTTPSPLGLFPNWFQKLPSVKRSLDPMMSVAIEGPLSNKLLEAIPPNSYGFDSIYNRLLDLDVKILILGLDLGWPPFIHFLDWIFKVPFRFDKLFTGKIKQDYNNWIYPVRTLIEESLPDGKKLGIIAVKKKILKSAPLGIGMIHSVNYRLYFELAIEQLKKNYWFLAKGPKVNVFQKELERLKEKPKKLVLPSYNSKDWIKILENQRRDWISLSTDAALNAIREHFRVFEIKEIPTGEYCLSWLVPERWSLYEAKLINTETGEIIVDASKNPAAVYSYSKAFEGEITKDKLLKHIAPASFLPNARPIVNVALDRDWGFSLTKEEISQLTTDRYYVKIETDYSLGKLRWLETVVEGKSSKEVILVAFLDGPFKANEHLSGVIALLELLNYAKYIKPKYSLRFLITVSGVGLPCWIEKNKRKLKFVEAILILTSLGRGNLFVLQLMSLQNSIAKSAIENLKNLKKPYQLLTEGFYQVLSYGGNPFVYYPHRENLEHRIKQFEREFGIKGRRDFLHSAEEIFTLDLPQKLLIFGRSLPVNALFFPFKGRGTDKDTYQEINWETFEETLTVLKKLLFP